MLDVGVGTFSGQRPGDRSRTVADTYADILRIARTAEAAGLDSLWLSSHHALPTEHISAPLILLSAVAARTSTIGLGTAMVLAPFQEPIRFAEDCATLDQLSRGRLTVGLGVGWREEEFAQFGVPLGQRAARTAALARFCRQAWDEPSAEIEGRTVRIRPRPFHRIPIALGGTAPAALRRAGRLADVFIATGTPQLGVEGFAAQLAVVDRAAVEAGRDPASIAVGFQANGWVSESGRLDAAVRTAMWSQIGSSLAAHAGVGSPPPIDDELIARRGFIGTPGRVVDAIRPWLEPIRGRPAKILVRLHYPGLTGDRAEEAVQLFGEQVGPALRQIAG